MTQATRIQHGLFSIELMTDGSVSVAQGETTVQVSPYYMLEENAKDYPAGDVRLGKVQVVLYTEDHDFPGIVASIGKDKVYLTETEEEAFEDARSST